MRTRAVLAVLCCFILSCSKGERPCDDPSLAGLIQQHPVHVLCGAADVLPDANVIADSTMELGWDTFEPEHLVDRVNREKLDQGIEQLCTLLDKLPPDARKEAAAGIASWVEARFAIDRTANDSFSIEYFASGVALVSELRPAVPAGAIERIPEDYPVGETMSSGEFTMMNYALAHILARMPEAERDRVLAEASSNALELMKREE